MSTLRQVLANRLNARRSTGPRTEEGKAVVAQNALRHGVFADSLIVEGEDPCELARHRDQLLADINPRGYSQELLAERIVSITWRLLRLARAEQFHHQIVADSERDDLAEHGEYPGETQDDQARHQLKRCRENERAWKEMERKRREWGQSQTCPAGLTTSIDLAAGNESAVARYSVYEKRLEGALHRAWRELRLLRKDRSERDDDPSESSPPSDPAQSEATNIANVQNKPIPDATDVHADTCASVNRPNIVTQSPPAPGGSGEETLELPDTSSDDPSSSNSPAAALLLTVKDP